MFLYSRTMPILFYLAMVLAVIHYRGEGVEAYSSIVEINKQEEIKMIDALAIYNSVFCTATSGSTRM